MGTETAAQPPSLLRRVVIGRNPKRTAVRILVTVVVCFVVFRFVLLPIRVEGISMMPTYRENKVNFVNRLAYARSDPKRGDVVSIRLAGNSVMYLKRIIAMPGETIEFHRGRAYINGQELDEPYVKFKCFWEIGPETLTSNEYYVVGDNRSMAASDHTKGRSGRERIVGKVLL